MPNFGPLPGAMPLGAQTITTADILAGLNGGGLGLLTAKGDPTKRPINPQALKPRAQAPAPQSTSGYTPEAVLKSQEDTANWFQSRPLAPMAGGGTAAAIAGGAANFGNGFMGTYLPTKAEEKMMKNQGIESSAYKAALAAGSTSEAAAALAGGSTAQQAQALAMQGDERKRATEHAAQLEQQKSLFEYQKRLQQDIANQERERMIEVIKQAAGGGQQPTQQPNSSAPAAAPPAAAGAPGGIDPAIGVPMPPAPVNPNVEFANSLLQPAGHPEASPAQKALNAMAFGEKGKAVDALNERGGKLTEGQTKDAGYAERMLRAEAGLREVIPTNKAGEFMKYDPTNKWFKFMPDWNMTNSSEWQQYNRNAREGIAAILRKDTGAAVSDTEWQWYYPMYYPQIGDSAQVVRDKQAARISLANGLRNASGPAFDQMFPKFNEQLRDRLVKAGADLTPKPTPAEGKQGQVSFLDGAVSVGIPKDVAAKVPAGKTIRDEETGAVYMNRDGVFVEVGKDRDPATERKRELMTRQNVQPLPGAAPVDQDIRNGFRRGVQ